MVCVPDEAVYLLAEHATIVLDQVESIAIAQAVDGLRDSDGVVDEIADQAPDLDLATLFFMVDEYLDKGYLIETPPHEDEELERMSILARNWLLPLPSSAQIRTTIGVGGIASGTADAREVVRALAETHLSVYLIEDAAELLVAAADPDVALLVVIADDYLEPLLAEIDDLRRSVHKKWLLARTAGANAWVGPVFSPGATACWHCMAQRIRGNRDVEEYLRLRTHAGDESIRPQAVGPGAIRALAAGLVATEAIHAVLSMEPAPAILHTFETMTWEHVAHSVVRRPQCSECGDPEPCDALHPPVILNPGGSSTINESGLRAVEPRVTLDRYAEHVSVITGAVTALTPIPVESEPSLHVYAAGHNFAMRGAELKYLRAGLRTKSSGKGMTEDQAKVSALGEALERYQGLYTGEERRRHTSLAELGMSGIHPNDIMLWSDQQYRDRGTWNALDQKFAVVPEPFDSRFECDFSPLWSLTCEETRWVPTGMLYYSVPRPSGHMFFIACSNGAAAGNTYEEAILQGALELVERDAVAIWWYNRLRRPEFDITGINDPRIHETLATYRRLGRPIALLDLTNDLGIPVVAAVSARESGVSEDILLGFGAHLDPAIAVMRAMSEVTQFYPGVAAHQPNGSGEYAYDDRESKEWWLTATRASEPYLVPDPSASRAHRIPASQKVDDITAAARAVQSSLEAAGHEVLVLDQTRPDIGFPTVKVIAPGLRHFWARYAPGRLYDVPTNLGWLSGPTPEESLNPRVMFL